MTVTGNPPLNAIVFDAESTPIVATSTEGATHYFKVLLSDTVSYSTTQSWSKINDTIANISINNTYRNAYNYPFVLHTATGIHHVPELQKSLQLTIQEYDLATDTLASQEVLPLFYVHASTFTHRNSIAQAIASNSIMWLDAIPDTSIVTRSSIVRLPLFVPTTGADVTLVVRSSATYVLHTTTITPTIVGSYDVVVNLGDYDLSHTTDIEIQVLMGDVMLSRKLITKRINRYSISEVVFKNNYGHWQHVYFFGKRSTSTKYKRSRYQLQNNAYNDYDVDATHEITVNTGYVSQMQVPVIDQLCESLEILLNISGRYVAAKFETRKASQVEDLEYMYNEDLVFSFKNTQL